MEELINNLVEKYSNMVLQIAYQHSFNKSDSEDITQEVFIKLVRNIDSLKDDNYIKAWLIRVTINLCKDYNKSYWNRNTSELDENLKEDSDFCEVMEYVSKLKPKYRDVIYLYYYLGYKINEIAEILKMNENTVSSNLTRARKELKEILEDGGEIYE